LVCKTPAHWRPDPSLLKTLLLALTALLLAPAPAAALENAWVNARSAEVPGLSARCTWAERGWSPAALALAGGIDQAALRFALEDYQEHARLHGWVGEPGDGLSSLVTEPARCPPAALIELSRFDLDHLNEGQARALGMLARAFAENGHVDNAVALLDHLRVGSLLEPELLRAEHLQDTATWQAARLFEQAERWDDALLYLNGLHSTGRWIQLAIDRSRAHSLAELGRVEELEQLVLLNLIADSSCRPLEYLLETWERTGSTKGLDSLLAATSRSVLDPFAKARLQAMIVLRYNSAMQHRRVLAMQPELALEQLPSLLDGGEHHHEVHVALRANGPSAVTYLQRRAVELVAGQPPLSHELRAVLAETGLPELAEFIENIDEESLGFPYLELWSAARDLRDDLRPDRVARGN